jgi:hypothetical protein
MFKGPIDHICLECGANNSIAGYVEFYDCYACGKRKTFKDGIKKYLKLKFSQNIDRTKADGMDNKYEKDIFKALNLSEADYKYISVRNDTVYFSFPLKVKAKIWVGGKDIELDIREECSIHEKVGEFFGNELSQGGFKTRRLGNGIGIGEVDFYKGISSDTEAKEAVKWLVEFKKRFGF